VRCHFEHTQRSRQKDNVDVAAHAEGVDTAKRIAQQETLAGLDRGAADQSSHCAEAETAGRLDGRDEDRARVVVAELNHAGTVAQPLRRGRARDAEITAGSTPVAQQGARTRFGNHRFATLRSWTVQTFTRVTT
jgi:hypothetical protein